MLFGTSRFEVRFDAFVIFLVTKGRQPLLLSLPTRLPRDLSEFCHFTKTYCESAP